MRIAFVFPGQGSQYVGMGKSFNDLHSWSEDIFLTAEKTSGLPIRQLCFEGPIDKLTETINLQPAVTAVNLVCWHALKASGINPDAVAGHSLGEWSALVAAGCIDATEALKGVALRGKIMQREAEANPGSMAAVMGLAAQEVANLCRQVTGVVQVANYNTPGQTVITGSKEAVNEAVSLIKDNKGKTLPLKVSGSWHSPLMEKAGEEMAVAISGMIFKPPQCLLAPNATGIPTKDPTAIKAELIRQITSSVYWVDTIKNLLDQGIDVFIEVGPKNVLSGMIEKIAPEKKALNVEDQESLEATLKALEA